MSDAVHRAVDIPISRTLLAGVLIALISLVVFFASGFGYQWDLWGLGKAFQLFKWGAVGGLSGLLLTTVGAAMSHFSTTFRVASMTWIGIIAGLIVAGTAVYFIVRARTAPSIHDITTDTSNPPEFIELKDIREEAPNEVEYAGSEVAEIQKEHYPDIQPLFLDMSVPEAFDKAAESARSMRWKIHAIDRENHRIEATHQIMWFGFKDDVVIRVRRDSARNRTRVDMRSASRIGKGDLGENARRIKRYMSTLRSMTESE